jgi:hypothetical protein
MVRNVTFSMKPALVSGLLLGFCISPIALSLVTPSAVLAATPQKEVERHNVQGGELKNCKNSLVNYAF